MVKNSLGQVKTIIFTEKGLFKKRHHKFIKTSLKQKELLAAKKITNLTQNNENKNDNMITQNDDNGINISNKLEGKSAQKYHMTILFALKYGSYHAKNKQIKIVVVLMIKKL